jgi:hypothetical protein
VWDVLQQKAPVGDRVPVYDVTRRWPGLGKIEFLVERGKKVLVVTPVFSLGEQIPPASVTLACRKILGSTETGIISSAVVRRIEGDAVMIENVFSGRLDTIEPNDTVVLSRGNRSDRVLYDELKGRAAELYAVGDAAAPRLIQQVICKAEELARSL